MAAPSYRLFDVDNHYYETDDAYTRRFRLGHSWFSSRQNTLFQRQERHSARPDYAEQFSADTTVTRPKARIAT